MEPIAQRCMTGTQASEQCELAGGCRAFDSMLLGKGRMATGTALLLSGESTKVISVRHGDKIMSVCVKGDVSCSCYQESLSGMPETGAGHLG